MRDGRGGVSEFTLIELLVVIAVITVILALLLPALGAAKEMAYSAACQAQLKQIGSQFMMYRADWANRFPAPRAYGSYNWKQAIDGKAPGEGVGKHFTCPGRKGRINTSSAAGKVGERANFYGMNMNLLPIGSCTTATLNDNYTAYKCPSQIDRPSMAGLVMETKHTVQTGGPAITCKYAAITNSWNNDFIRHTNASNVLFVDGHVERIPALNFPRTDLFWLGR